MDNIQVGIRTRPLIDNEKAKNLVPQWAIQRNNIFQIDESGQRISEPYSFDHIFDKEKTNQAIYNDIVQEFVQCSIDGLNSTIFAYGQTSSGKTHTMTGNADDPGIMVLAINDIFDKIKFSTQRKYLLRMSYIEIYNEKIIDLLDPVSKEIKIREHHRGGITLHNVREEIVTCTEQVHELLELGNNKKHISGTNMNERSSRSHTILRFLIESTEDAVKISYLNLVDLAGSERVAHTKATGVRLKEGGHINKSLSALSLVIKQLSDGNEFINFRDSKLTRLLQDSLGGNAKTLIIAAVTVASVEDTHSTLSFAQRAKTVKNKPKINEIVSDQEMHKRYAQLNENLKGKLDAQLQINRQLSHTQEASRRKIMELQEQMQLLEVFQHGKSEEVVIPKRRHTIGIPGQKKQLQAIREVSEDSNSNPEFPFLPTITYSRECISPLLPLFDDFNNEHCSFLSNGDGQLLTASPVSETPRKLLRERASYLDKEYAELVTYTNEEQEIHKKRDREIEELKIVHASTLEELEKLKANRNDIMQQNEELLALNSLHLHKIETLEKKFKAKESEYQRIKTAFEQQETHKYEEELIVNQWKSKFKRRETELLEKIYNLDKTRISIDKSGTETKTKDVGCDAGSEWYDSIVKDLLALQEIIANEAFPTEVLETSQLVNDSLLNTMETSRQIIQEEINKQVVKLDQFDDWLEDVANISNEVEGFSHLLQEFTILNEVNEINDQTEKMDEIKFFLNVYKCLLKVNKRYTVYTKKMHYDKSLLESLKTDLACVQNKLQSVELDSNSQKDENCILKKTVEVLEKELRENFDNYKKHDQEFNNMMMEINNSLNSNSFVSFNESLNETIRKNVSHLEECEKDSETEKKCNSVIEELKTEVEQANQSYANEKESLDHYVNLTRILDDQIVSLADESTKKHHELIDLRNRIRKLRKNLRKAEKLNIKQKESITSLEMQLSEVGFLQEDLALNKSSREDQKIYIDNLEAKIRENHEDLQKIKNELEEKVTVVNTLESQKEQLIAESQFTSQQLNEYVILSGEYKEQLQSAEKTVKQKQEEILDLLAERDKSEEMNNNKYQLLTENIAERDNEIKELKIINEQYQVQMNEHNVACQQVKLDLEQALRIKEELNCKIAELNTELTNIVKSNKNLITTKEDNKKQILLLTNTNNDLLDRISTLENRIEEELGRLKIEQSSCADSDNEIIKLQKRFDIVNIEKQDLQQSLAEFKNKSIQLKNDYEKYKYESETEINLLSQKNAELSSQVDKLCKEIASLKNKFQTINETEGQLKNKNKEIREKEELIETLQFERSRLKNQIENLTIKLESDEHVILKFKEDFNNCKQQKLDLEKKLQDKNILIENLKEQINIANSSANETINKLKDTIQVQTGEIFKSQKKIKDILEIHQAEIKAINEKMKTIEVKNNLLEEKQQKNNKENQRLLAAKNLLEKTVSELTDQRDKLQNQLDEQSQRVIGAEDELKDMTNQYNNICKTFEEEKQIYKQYKQKSDAKKLSLEEAVKHLHEKNSALHHELLEKEECFNQAASGVNRIQNLAAQCQQCTQMKDKLEKLKKEDHEKRKEILKLQLQICKPKPPDTPSSDLLLHYQSLCKDQREKLEKLEKARVMKQSIEIQCNILSFHEEEFVSREKYEKVRRLSVLRMEKINSLTAQVKRLADR